MSKKQILLIAFAVIHLTVVVVSAFGVRYTGCGWLDRAVGTYAFATGSGDRFGFFCSVPNQVRATFKAVQADGATLTDSLWHEPINHEAELRYGVSLSFFGNMDDESRKQLLGSWSATIFGRHPHAVRVEVRMEACIVPDLTELQSGKQPRWVEIYSAVFEQNSPAR
jgi:hypothetical protein